MSRVSPFGLPTPIFQAPTGSVAGPELAAAVAEAGGMGAMGLTWTEPDVAAGYVRQVKERTSGLFQVNFALAFPPDALTAVLDAGAPAVTFSWGDASPYVQMVKSAGALLGIQVTSVAGTKRAVDLGADFLVCQGTEAGGHVQASTGLWELLPRVLEAAGSVPVVAAGGIGDGAGIARALSAGAAGAMLGTRFVATEESRAHQAYKKRIVEAKAADTALTVCFDGGWPQAMHRVLRNRTLEEWEAAGSPPRGHRPGEEDVVGYAANGEPVLRYEDTAPRIGMSGAIDEMCLYAGTSCDAVHDIPSAKELVIRLCAEYRQALQI